MLSKFIKNKWEVIELFKSSVVVHVAYLTQPVHSYVSYYYSTLAKVFFLQIVKTIIFTLFIKNQIMKYTKGSTMM
jgi:hypothetical protein